ncbi:MAG: hypothetical protein JXQ82_09160 [Methanomicrobiaceae archaeon]|nr:hypothetical protein [Methanomicrobiaceae archaeon]
MNISWHKKKGPFFKSTLKKIFGENRLRNLLFCCYVFSLMFGSGFNAQKKLLPRPDLSIDFAYHSFYMTRVRPKAIKNSLNQGWWDEGVTNLHRFVLDGDWDICCTPLRDTSKKNLRQTTIVTINQLFVDKIDYKKCDQYLEMRELIEKGEPAYWCKSIKDIDEYFNILYSLYDSLKNNQYRTQEELKASDLTKVDKRQHNSIDEIRISVGREGDLILGMGGTHRVLIADLLDFEAVPVIIEGVHIEWARKCCEKHGADIISSVILELEHKLHVHQE